MNCEFVEDSNNSGVEKGGQQENGGHLKPILDSEEQDSLGTLKSEQESLLHNNVPTPSKRDKNSRFKEVSQIGTGIIDKQQCSNIFNKRHENNSRYKIQTRFAGHT